MSTTRREAAKRYPTLGQLIAVEMKYDGGRSTMEVIDRTISVPLGSVSMATVASRGSMSANCEVSRELGGRLTHGAPFPRFSDDHLAGY